MKRILVIFLLFSLFSLRGQGQIYDPLKKQWLFKVDPASGLFHEFRASVEKRWGDSHRFWYGAPFITRQNSLRNQQNQPMKIFGGGVRLAIRQFMFTRYSPKGFFLHAGLGLRTRRVRFIDQDNLLVTEKSWIHSPGLNAAAGYQWLLAPRAKNIAIGFSGGLEYFYNIYESGKDRNSYVRNWYTIPFLDEFRVFLTFEVGFAWRRLNLHW